MNFMDMRTGIDVEMDNGDLVSLIKHYNYGRYCEDPKLPIEASRKLVVDHVRKYLLNNGSRYAAYFSSPRKLLGVMLFKLSTWDTEHFGFNVAVIDSVIVEEVHYDQKLEIVNALLRQFDSWCKAADVRFVSVRVPAMDLAVIHSLECWGFRYIESWIYNKYDLDKADEFRETAYELRLALPEDCSLMIDYCRGAFLKQRFHADPNITWDKADSLYEKWILTAYEDPRQNILVLDIDNRQVAFMIYYINDLRQYFGLQYAMWKMAVIDPAIRGKGLGTDFFVALIQIHRRDGLDVVDSGLSMRNVASLNLHNKLRFRVISSVVTLHKWLK